MNSTLKNIFLLAAFCTTAFTAHAQNSYKIHKYNSNDGGILTKITPNGKWGLIQLGTSAGGGNAEPSLYNIDTEEITPIQYSGRAISASAMSDDANIIVGSMSGRPVAFNRATNKVTVFAIRPLWQSAHLTAVTPDGKWAVGSYNGYNGKLDENDDLSHDYYYSPLFVNVETGDTIATPGLPKRDMAGLDQHAMRFDDITPDGRYIIGEMSWYIMQPNSPVTFVYDTQEHTYRIVGFTEKAGGNWTPLFDGLHHLEGPCISPDGHWLTGMAYIARPMQDSQFFNESGMAYRYDIPKGTFEVLENAELNVETCIIDNKGTVFGNPSTGGPLRDFRVLYQDKYWITLDQICKQQYGFNFREKTGYERTGSVISVSGDASRIISFPDPLGESYCFDFGKPIEEICDGIDLLDNYTVSPAAGSVFSQISTFDINFGRSIQIIGKGNTHVHLYKEDGTKVADALSTASGFALKTGSNSTATAVFRTRQLEDGVTYYLVIDAGAVAVSHDASRVNKEIRIKYQGRRDGPVKMVKAAPENNSQLRQLDASSSYVLLTFDCPVKLTNDCLAYVQIAENGQRLATLSVGVGNTETTKNQILLYPTAPLYLYEGTDYQVVLAAESVCDYAGTESSYNEGIVLNYHGTYMREVSNDEVIFADSWDNISESLQTWLRYEGDHNTPLASMQAMEFDADNQPWNFSLRESTSAGNYFAASHSLYSPSGRSDDWMMTPQLLMPKDGKAVLEFDAQNYRENKKDTLKVFVFEEEFNIAYLNKAWMDDIKERAVLLDEILLTPGETEDGIEGEWTHYSYDLSKWADKNIYIAFVNQNYNQSMIFIDNVKVQRELLYSIAFSNEDRVVAKNSVDIAGQFTVKSGDNISNISLVLKDSKGKEVDKVEWTGLTSSVKDKALPFAFSKPLPLTVGEVNNYTIAITLGSRTDVYKGSIASLAFEPTKRVVLEEMTGIDCPNCPLGILTIEKCEKAFGDKFIPISIHTYTGDPYAGTMGGYSQFLGLNAAPSARINRIEGIYYPMDSSTGTYIDSNPTAPLWYDIITRELSTLASTDISLDAMLSQDGKTINYQSDIRYALNTTDQQLSLLLVVLEDGLVNYQASNLGSLDYEILGEWGQGGAYSSAYVHPFTHNDVARLVVGQTMSGTIGLYPSTLEAGKVYTANLSSTYPASIADPANASVVAMLIDSQSGEVINAAKSRVRPYSEGGLSSVTTINADIYSQNYYDLQGRRVLNPTHGIYIKGGKKVYIK